MTHLRLAWIISLFLLAACSKGVEGNYTLDKEATTKQLKAEVAKMSKEKQAFAKMAMGMIETMDIKLSLEKGGKATMMMKMGGKEKKEEGSWKKDGDKIIIEAKGQKKPMSCTLSAGVLTCAEGKNSMIFKRS